MEEVQEAANAALAGVLRLVAEAKENAEPSFWETSTGGVVIGALLSLAAALLLSLLTGSREDRVQARRARRDAGVESIRVAYRLRDGVVELLAARSARGQNPKSQAHSEYVALFDRWQAASARLGEQIPVARATALPEVADLLDRVGSADKETVEAVTNATFDADHHVSHLDFLIGHMAEVVAKDARVHAGTVHATGLGAKIHGYIAAARLRRQMSRKAANETPPPPEEQG